MPIYEFKCLKCQEFFELLTMSKEEDIEFKCPKCKSREFERVLSVTSYTVGNSAGRPQRTSAQTRTCPAGSCTTYDIPGSVRAG